MVSPVSTSSLHGLVTSNHPGYSSFKVLFSCAYLIFPIVRQVLEGQAHDLCNSLVDTEPFVCLMLNIELNTKLHIPTCKSVHSPTGLWGDVLSFWGLEVDR